MVTTLRMTLQLVPAPLSHWNVASCGRADCRTKVALMVLSQQVNGELFSSIVVGQGLVEKLECSSDIMFLFFVQPVNLR